MSEQRIARGAGILLPITSLPSKYGIGTLGKAAYDFVDLLVEMGQKYWQVLPLGPTGYGDSPYQALSAFAGNPYLIDLDLLIKEGLLTRQEVESVNWEKGDGRVDYGLIYAGRFKVLRAGFNRFAEKVMTDEYNRFCAENAGWLEDYALYMAIKESQGGKNWTEWEPVLRDREENCMREMQKKLKSEMDFWKFCQYKFFMQWNALHAYAAEKGVGIIGDIPLYVSHDSADVWAHREEFLLGADGKPAVVSGCPPDAFSEFGQKWGNPIYDWEKMERDDFSWWRKRIEANERLFDIVRMDHFIGVVQYYSIPQQDEDGRNGRWNKGPGQRLTDVIDEILGKGRVIAEDLGVDVPEVKRLMKKIGWPGMKNMIYAFDGNAAHEYLPHNYTDTNTVVYPGTHDSDTLMGFWDEKTEADKTFLYNYLNISGREQIADAIIRVSYSSIAALVVVQMQDMLGLGNESRMNLPATLGENWRWRFKGESLTEAKKKWVHEMTVLYRR